MQVYFVQGTSGLMEGEISVGTKNIDTTQPRRSSRQPKKKPWLLELERERDSKGEDSGRETGKKTSRRETSASSDDLNSDQERTSDDGLASMNTSGRGGGKSPRDGGEFGLLLPAKRGRPSGRGRGRPRGKPRGRPCGSLNRKQLKNVESSSNTSENDDSRSPVKGKKKVHVGREFSDDSYVSRRGFKGKTKNQGEQKLDVKGKRAQLGPVSLSSDSESDVDTDVHNSQESGHSVKSIKQEMRPKQKNPKVSSDSSEDDLPLTMIKLLAPHKDNDTKDKQDVKQKIDLSPDSKVIQVSNI